MRSASVLPGIPAGLGLAWGFVVHAADVARLTLEPEDFGVPRADASALKGRGCELQSGDCAGNSSGFFGAATGYCDRQRGGGAGGSGKSYGFSRRRSDGEGIDRLRRCAGQAGSLGAIRVTSTAPFGHGSSSLVIDCARNSYRHTMIVSGLTSRDRRERSYTVPECRLRICGRFCENAERASTISQPVSWAACFNSPCT